MQQRSDVLAEALRQVGRALILVADEILEPSAKQPMPAVENRLLSVAETAERLGVSERGVRRLILRGDLPQRKVGARVLIPASAIEEYVSKGAAS